MNQCTISLRQSVIIHQLWIYPSQVNNQFFIPISERLKLATLNTCHVKDEKNRMLVLNTESSYLGVSIRKARGCVYRQCQRSEWWCHSYRNQFLRVSFRNQPHKQPEVIITFLHLGGKRRLYFLGKHKKAKFPSQVIVNSYREVIKSVLNETITKCNGTRSEPEGSPAGDSNQDPEHHSIYKASDFGEELLVWSKLPHQGKVLL